MDALRHCIIGDSGVGRFNIDNQIGLIIAICFGEVDFVTDPIGLTLGGIACVGIVGRGDISTTRRDVVMIAPSCLPFDDGEILNPDLPQDINGGQDSEFGLRRGAIRSGEDGEAICTNLLGPHPAFGLALG